MPHESEPEEPAVVLLRETQKRFVDHPEEATLDDVRLLALSATDLRETCARQARITGGVAIATTLWVGGQRATMHVTSPAMEDERIARVTANTLRFFQALGGCRLGDEEAEADSVVDTCGTFQTTARTADDAQHRPIPGDRRIDPGTAMSWVVLRACEWAVEIEYDGVRHVESLEDWSLSVNDIDPSIWVPKVTDDVCVANIEVSAPLRPSEHYAVDRKVLDIYFQTNTTPLRLTPLLRGRQPYVVDPGCVICVTAVRAQDGNDIPDAVTVAGVPFTTGETQYAQAGQELRLVDGVDAAAVWFYELPALVQAAEPEPEPELEPVTTSEPPTS